MKVSIDDIVDRTDPWDLVLTIDGTDYQIRPVLLGDLEVLIGALTAAVPNIAQVRETLGSLFHIEPRIAEWEMERVMAVVQAVVGYLTARSKKNPSAPAATHRPASRTTPVSTTEESTIPALSGS